MVVVRRLPAENARARHGSELPASIKKTGVGSVVERRGITRNGGSKANDQQQALDGHADHLTGERLTPTNDLSAAVH